MNREFVMRYMVEYGLDAEVPPSKLSDIGFGKMLHDFGAYQTEEDNEAMTYTRGLILLRVDGWISCKFDPMLISLTQKSKDLLKADSG